MKKLLSVVFVFAVLFSTLWVTSAIVKSNLVGDYLSESMSSSNSSERSNKERFEFEKDVIKNIDSGITAEEFRSQVEDMDKYVFYQKMTDTPEEYANDLWTKVQRLRNPVVSPVDVLLSALAAILLGYWYPDLILKIRERKRKSGMQLEVDSLSLMLSVRSKSPTIMVKDLLGWCVRYSTIFNREFTRAYVRFDKNPKEALDNLVKAVDYFPMQRLIDKMTSSYEGTPIVDSFNSLEQDLEYSRDTKKLDNQKSLTSRLDTAKTLAMGPIALAFCAVFLLPWALLFLKTLIPILKTMNTLQGGA